MTEGPAGIESSQPRSKGYTRLLCILTLFGIAILIAVVVMTVVLSLEDMRMATPTDAPDSSCSGGKVPCLNGRCIRVNQLCDNVDDCGDNSDEVDCI